MYLQTGDYVATGSVLDTIRSMGSQIGGAIGQWTGRFGSALDREQLQAMAKGDAAYVPPTTPVSQPSSGISTTTLLLGGAAVVGLIYFLKKR